MSTLATLLANRIRAGGPITIADYMADCLMHPRYGYYATRDPFGAAGDFTTAPEISQMFGELLGLCLAQTWLSQNSPAPFALAELGPGRGTLMADALRATRAVPGFHAALSLHLVETSATLRQRQKTTLVGFAPTWHDSTATLPQAPLFALANEFFDALPIRQFQRAPQGWRERVVGLEGDILTLGLADRTRPAFLAHRQADTAPGEVVEICPLLPGIIADLAGRIAAHGGAALILDYGDWRSCGDTFQALRSHARADPFAEPGLADLTAHVDFEAIARAAHPAHCSRMIAQGALLERLGIALRARTLAQSLTGQALILHSDAYRRLTHPAEMGNLFKAVALYPPHARPPPGFDA